MKITGSGLLDLLTTLNAEVKILKQDFATSLTYFKSDAENGVEIDNPKDIILLHEALQTRIAKIQDIQSAYNIYVKVDIDGETIPLQRAVNLINDLAYTKNQWEAQRVASYRVSGHSRNKDVENVIRVVSTKEAKELAKQATIVVGVYRDAIREGNSTRVETSVLATNFGIEGIDDSLFAKE